MLSLKIINKGRDFPSESLFVLGTAFWETPVNPFETAKRLGVAGIDLNFGFVEQDLNIGLLDSDCGEIRVSKYLGQILDYYFYPLSLQSTSSEEVHRSVNDQRIEAKIEEVANSWAKRHPHYTCIKVIGNGEQERAPVLVLKEVLKEDGEKETKHAFPVTLYSAVYSYSTLLDAKRAHYSEQRGREELDEIDIEGDELKKDQLYQKYLSQLIQIAQAMPLSK